MILCNVAHFTFSHIAHRLIHGVAWLAVYEFAFSIVTVSRAGVQNILTVAFGEENECVVVPYNFGSLSPVACGNW